LLVHGYGVDISYNDIDRTKLSILNYRPYSSKV